jgi:hypothetical protein
MVTDPTLGHKTFGKLKVGLPPENKQINLHKQKKQGNSMQRRATSN